MGITILADLDGTLLPRPFGTGRGAAVAHPNISSGPAYAPLVRLLDLGATVVGVTGSQLGTHRTRFFEDLPLEHRRDGRVLLAVQTGARLYRPAPDDGSPVRDSDFCAHLARSVSASLDEEVVRELISVGRDGIRRFFADLERDPALVDADGPLGYLHGAVSSANAREVPVSGDGDVLPRIEVREGNSAVVFVGVPSTLGALYFDVPPSLEGIVDGRPTGRSAFDCVPAGLDKSHVVRYLIDSGVVSAGRAVAIGDQPAGNDEGLTRWHRHDGGCDIPFVAVSEREAMVPLELRECHVTSASNVDGSAVVLGALAEMLEGQRESGDDGQLHLNADVVSSLVGDLNVDFRAHRSNKGFQRSSTV